MSTSDVESFTGKIVCNIDGSSYIIDAENATLSSLNDNSLSGKQCCRVKQILFCFIFFFILYELHITVAGSEMRDYHI